MHTAPGVEKPQALELPKSDSYMCEGGSQRGFSALEVVKQIAWHLPDFVPDSVPDYRAWLFFQKNFSRQIQNDKIHLVK